jgi:hypothetical protein
VGGGEFSCFEVSKQCLLVEVRLREGEALGSEEGKV